MNQQSTHSHLFGQRARGQRIAVEELGQVRILGHQLTCHIVIFQDGADGGQCLGPVVLHARDRTAAAAAGNIDVKTGAAAVALGDRAKTDIV